jgi:hypothetical protein
MRKFAICCIAVAAMFVPAAQAGTKCYHLTNFCDGLQTTTFPSNSGTAVVGLWDYLCLANNTGTPVGGAPTKFGTQPTNPYFGGTGAGAYLLFTLNNNLHQFDLWESFDGVTVFVVQTNQPFTTTKGACNPLVNTNGKPPAVLR